MEREDHGRLSHVILQDGHVTLKVSKNSNILGMGAAPGDVIEEGTLRKHQSGAWIISNDEKTYLSKRSAGAREGLPSLISTNRRSKCVKQKSPAKSGAFWFNTFRSFVCRNL